MGKKVNQEDVIRDLFQDPRYIPDSRPLQRKLPNMPLMLSSPSFTLEIIFHKNRGHILPL